MSYSVLVLVVHHWCQLLSCCRRQPDIRAEGRREVLPDIVQAGIIADRVGYDLAAAIGKDGEEPLTDFCTISGVIVARAD